MAEKARRWEIIQEEINKHDGIRTFSMGRLRKAAGYAQLGVHVRAEIAETLEEMGLGHIPEELPKYQECLIRLYDKEVADLGELFSMLSIPSRSTDAKLRKIYESSAFNDNIADAQNKIAEYEAIIENIRELVAESDESNW